MTGKTARPASPEPLVVERDGGLCVLRLNRPEAYNALDEALAEALLEAAVECDHDETVRAVMITGTGAAFGAGGDIRAMQAHADENGRTGAFLKRLTVPFHEAVATFAHMPKPVIAAVNGVAAGAGFSLALACDMIVAARSASFTMAYTRIAMAPDGSSTFYLPRAVGFKRAFELIALNPLLSADEARELGIVARVLDDDGFAEAARALARELAEGPTRALGEAKRLLTLSASASLETQMENERRAIAACGDSADGTEGRRAFLDKRAPRFEGR